MLKLEYMEKVDNSIICDDVLNGLSRIPDSSVTLVITSPPYNVDAAKWEYDKASDSQPYLDYLAWLKNIFTECYRVLRKGGRLIVNIDAMTNRQDDKGDEYIRDIRTDITNNIRPIGFKTFGEHVWYKSSLDPSHNGGQFNGKKTAWGCFDDQTEVLTSDGFKYFKDLNGSEKFATINLLTRKLEYQAALQYHEYNYCGEMFHLKHRSMDVMVTPNHNMLVGTRCNRKHVPTDLGLVQMQYIAEKSFVIPMRHTGYDGGKDMDFFTLQECPYGKHTNPAYKKKDVSFPMDDWLRFLGIFLTDGNCSYSEATGVYKVSVYQKKVLYLSEIRELLQRLPFSFEYKPSKSEFYCCDKQLAYYLKNLGNKNKRLVPAFIKDLSIRQKNIFLDWLWKGDGHIGEVSYLAVASNTFCDTVLQLLVEVGKCFTVSKKFQTERMCNGKIIRSNYPINIISLRVSDWQHVEKRSKTVSQPFYEGKVYCVSVPNKTLFTKRNGKFAWCGNSYMMPSTPIVRRNHEYILVYSKDEFTLPPEEGSSGKPDITGPEFQTFIASVWSMHPETRKLGGHPVPYPEELPYRCIKLYSYPNDLILDPFNGSGTTCAVAKKTGRRYVGIDMSEHYCQYARERIANNVNIFDDE